MKSLKTKANLITNKSNIKYLSNFAGTNGFMLICDRTNYLFTDSRYLLETKDNVYKNITVKEIPKDFQKIIQKHKISTIGIEENNLTITQFKKFKKLFPKIKFKNISGEIEKIRESKSKEEIKIIQKSQEINEKVLVEIKKVIKKQLKTSKITLKEIDLVFEIKILAQKFGADDISFDPIVAFGKNSATPHHLSNNTILKKGDVILIDMGMKYKNYCSDMTRTFFTKPPTKFEEKIYNLVLESQNKMISTAKTNISGQELDKIGREIIEKAGYSKEYNHSGGHGIGLDIHETPSLHSLYKTEIQENSIITIEPGIYLRNKFGIRIEDMILVNKNGSKNLTKISKNIEVL